MEKNLIKAAYLYAKACDLKDGLGCSNLGVLYQNGQGVEKDLIEAAYLYSKACKLGEQLACKSLKELK
ncbi:tetratricopeptide repeat protein [Helicobacter pylori]